MTGALSVEATPVPGLLVVRLPVHEDARGWFKEAWQRQKMVDLGLPDFTPVQANVSFNNARGATRGLHAEPWDKLVSVSTGRAFGAWVDLRDGASFGAVFTIELTPEVAVFVPRGVANSYQTLTDGVAYSYLVNAHWRPGVPYKAVALDDPTCAIQWPVPLAKAAISDKDRLNPTLSQVDPFEWRRPLIIGANGQLGRALQLEFPEAHAVARDELDLANPPQLRAWPWQKHDIVLNAAAYTRVDEAETPQGRVKAWEVNATGPAVLAQLAREYGFKLVHFSSDYVYEGAAEVHDEYEHLAPLGVYGQSKAAGDIAVQSVASDSLILRTAWVVGHGQNFVATMVRLADEGVRPQVVDDQHGRLTFTPHLARATRQLVEAGAAGVIHVTGTGPMQSWFEIARSVFQQRGRDPEDVKPVSSSEYAKGRLLAPRPRLSDLNLQRLSSFTDLPPSSSAYLTEWIRELFPQAERD